MNPKVSIVMATYNRAHFIAETLYAIQNQTFSDWECIIIDDGGNDNTVEVIMPFLQNDNRFKFHIRNDNYLKGLPGCRNFGLDLSLGDNIIFFDDDDIPHPQNLELCVYELENKRRYFCRYVREVFTENFHYNFDYSRSYSSFEINEKDVVKMLTDELQFNSCAVMWKKECFENNRFVENLMYAEEWELYARIVSSGYSGISINKTLFYGRKHWKSNTGEFYSNNPMRRNSFADAIILSFENLKHTKLLNPYIIRYFVVIAHNYEEFNLFNRIIKTLDLSLLNEIKLRIFFFTLKVRLPINRSIANYKRIRNQNKS